MKQMDNKELREAMKATQKKVDASDQRNDSELQSVRELIEVQVTHFDLCLDSFFPSRTRVMDHY